MPTTKAVVNEVLGLMRDVSAEERLYYMAVAADLIVDLPSFQDAQPYAKSFVDILKVRGRTGKFIAIVALGELMQKWSGDRDARAFAKLYRETLLECEDQVEDPALGQLINRELRRMGYKAAIATARESELATTE